MAGAYNLRVRINPRVMKDRAQGKLEQLKV